MKHIVSTHSKAQASHTDEMRDKFQHPLPPMASQGNPGASDKGERETRAGNIAKAAFVLLLTFLMVLLLFGIARN